MRGAQSKVLSQREERKGRQCTYEFKVKEKENIQHKMQIWIQGNSTITLLYWKELPMNAGINFCAMVALRTAFYTQNNSNKKLFKKKLGVGERSNYVTGFK